MKIALFGGSFDPPHLGHMLAAIYVLGTADLDRLWFIPCYQHAFGKPLAPYEHRLAMCLRALEILPPTVEVSSVEGELKGISRTVDTVRHLQEKHPEHSFSLVVGSDLLSEQGQWKDGKALREMLPMIVVGRAGSECEPAACLTIPNVNSTAIRRRLSQGEAVSHLMPRSVLEYIEDHGLYGA